MFETEYDRPLLDERELTGFIATQSRDQTTSTARLRHDIQPGERLLRAVGSSPARARESP